MVPEYGALNSLLLKRALFSPNCRLVRTIQVWLPWQKTQNLNEFELHCRAVLALPIPEIRQERAGASAVILSPFEGVNPQFFGLEKVCENPRADVRIFGKEQARLYRRMGVVVVNDAVTADAEKVKDEAKALAKLIEVKPA